MIPWIQKGLKRRAKDYWKVVRITVQRRNQGFAPDDLAQMINRLGIRAGDTVLVHSSLDQFAGFLGKPIDIIRVLQQAVSPGGTLMMPTLPFRGSAVEYAQTGAVFDVRKTPSQMGLLTELFRRSSDTCRSVHPTHPIAAWGERADQIIADHYRAESPCGVGTPYGYLLRSSGKILFLGTDISTMTFFHTVEDILEPQMPFSPFTRDFFVLRSVDWSGNMVTTRTRLFEPQYSRKRNIKRLVPHLKTNGFWREKRLGSLNALLLSAAEVLELCSVLAKRGIFCYDI